jgi:hypothetical protein
VIKVREAAIRRASAAMPAAKELRDPV